MKVPAAGSQIAEEGTNHGKPVSVVFVKRAIACTADSGHGSVPGQLRESASRKAGSQLSSEVRLFVEAE